MKTTLVKYDNHHELIGVDDTLAKFKVGTIVTIEGIAFKIKKITKKDVVMRPVGMVKKESK